MGYILNRSIEKEIEMIIDSYVHDDDALNDLIVRFVKFVCKEYSILPRKISIEGCDLHNANGMCFDEDEGIFTILVQDNRDLGQIFTTVAHEMIHVKQYMTQDLGRILDEFADTPYGERWWEEEAFANSTPLVEKFSKNI